MASGDSLALFTAASNFPPDWQWVAYTSGSAEPTVGETVHGDTSAADAYLEYYIQLTGTWAGGDSAGWMFYSNWDGNAWTSGENVTAGGDTAANDWTHTGTPASCYATLDTVNGILVLDFDQTTNEVALFTGRIPQHYSASPTGLTVTLALAGSVATGDFSFAGMFRSFTDDTDNLLHTSFNAWGTRASNTAIDAPTVVGEITYDDLTFADGAATDNLAAGEDFHLLIFRDAQDSTNDDAAGDAQLVSVEIKET